jgi:hypothetical protein
MSSQNKGQSRAKSADKQSRRERVAQMRAEEQRKDRRRNLLMFGTAGLIAVAIVTAAVIAVVQQRSEDAEPIVGLVEVDDLTNTHVQGDVEYDETPPLGGDHNEAWLNCGVYSEPVPNENAVHSLEHGAVWITYQPDLDESSVETLRDFVNDQNRATRDMMLLSPYEGTSAPVVVSAWGRQVELDSADDPRLDRFTREFVNGNQSPEPLAACTGGVGTPDA